MMYKYLSTNGQVVSAPLANIAGSAYRQIARKYGAALAYSEMVSVDGLVRGNLKTLSMLRMREVEKPVCYQIFGHDPEIMYDASQIVAQNGCDMIDINFGCPAKKIVKNSGGAALLKDLNLVEKIISSVVKAVDIPVSVKFRSGWDRENPAYLRIGKIAEECGASYLVLHPRTRTSGFKGKSDWSKIRELKESVKIKVIGSGDVTTPQEARQMLDETGCDYVMVGRAAMGAPWIFGRIDHYLKTGADPGDPPLEEKINIMLDFCRLMIVDFGERSACLKLRKHLAWFTRGWRNVSAIRRKMFEVETYDDIVNVLNGYLHGLDRVA
jgi:tRNA-dihydrouridine synthase B